MRKVEIADRSIEVRPLTRGEIKQLTQCGYTCMGCVPTLETADDSQNKAMELVLPPEDIEFLDSRPNRDATTVWKEILKETYGDPEEEKN